MWTSRYAWTMTMMWCLALAAPVAAQAPAPDVDIQQAWIREATAGQASTAAYFVVQNRSTSPVTITGLSTPIAATAEIHTMQMQHSPDVAMPHESMGGMMRMMRVAEVVVPAQGTVEFKPGGYHVMLFKIAKALPLGSTVELTIQFAGGATRKVAAVVGSRTAVTAPDKK